MQDNKSLNTWLNNGKVSKEVIDFWNTLKQKSNLELSNYIPFVQLSIVELEIPNSNEIKNLISYSELNWLKSSINSENKKGYYGLENFDIEVSGTANSLFKMNTTVKIYDPQLLFLKKDKISKLIKLGTTVKVDFGWQKFDTDNDTSINTYHYHGGQGHTIYAKVSGMEVSFDELNIMSVNLQMTAPTYNIMNNKKTENIFELKWDELNNIKKIPETGIFFNLFFKRDGILLKDLITYIEQQIKQKEKVFFIPNINLNQSINKNELGETVSSDILLDGNTIGDFLISIKLIEDIYSESKNYRKFIKLLINEINSAYEGNLNLELIKTPRGNESVIIDKASSENLWQQRENFLKIDFGHKNTLVKNITFSSDLNDGMQSQEIMVNSNNVLGATPKKIKEFALTWIYNKDEWEDLSSTAKNDIKKLFDKPDSELMKIVSTEFNPMLTKNKKGEMKDFLKQFQDIMVNRKIRNNVLKYLPFSVSLTIWGISDIWTGASFYFDEHCINPFMKNTIWRITSLTHQLSDNNWETNIEAKLYYHYELEQIRNKIKQLVG